MAATWGYIFSKNVIWFNPFIFTAYCFAAGIQLRCRQSLLSQGSRSLVGLLSSQHRIHHRVSDCSLSTVSNVSLNGLGIFVVDMTKRYAEPASISVERVCSLPRRHSTQLVGRSLASPNT
jgi:hypothetical protein